MSPETTNKHLVWIDVAKGLGIFLIIFGHLSYDLKAHYVHNLIYSFHIPFFFVLSGFVFTIKPGTTFAGFLKNKIRRILVPLIFFVLLGLVVGLCIRRPINVLSLVKYVFYWDGTYYWNMPCWFFLSLFVVYIICYLLKLPSRKLWLKIVLMTSFFLAGFLITRQMEYIPSAKNPFLKFGIDRTIIVTGFFIAGNIISDFNRKWSFNDKKHQIRLIPVLIVVVALWVVLAIVLNRRVSLYMRIFGNYWSFVGSSIFGSITFMILSIFLSNLNFFSKVFKMWQKNTILIASTHYIYRCSRLLFQAITTSMGIFKSVWSDLFMIVFIVALLMLYVPVGYLVDKYIPWVTGVNPTFYREIKAKKEQQAS